MKALRFAICAAAGLVSSAPALAAPLKVACVGDSITQLSGWPDKLGARLGAGYTSTNDGLAGTTLLKKGDNPYWASKQYTDSHAANPDIVVIMLGTNDSKAFNWTAHKGEFVGDYEALIDTYVALPSHPRIYLNLCPPAGTNGYQIVGSVIENEILPLIKQIARDKGLQTIDIFDAFGGHTFDASLYGSTADQVHPNAKGAQVIADTVYAALVAPPADAGAADAGAADTGAADTVPADAKNVADARGDGPESHDAASDPNGVIDSGAPPADTASTSGAAGGGAAGAAGGVSGAAGGQATGAAGSGAKSSGGCACALSPDAAPLGGLALVSSLVALALARRRPRRRVCAKS